ncbi:glycoside hydrolase family 70 protein [Lactobacillus sp. Sy-1]|uniref:glycoside hydrolase family 70 protein n=1 Tax=Lactobacillus sp. Sy-1 TaxID=2109645 RepID=UPI001C57E57D|nr:glycoside hydrolase family 70 protein [Lactobacillus sp. Sy-1]MBW1604839.1 KxYKxGKxW signal peptide domain-containing protein [Lactobacillus sp. Sy-1]
MFRQQSPKKHYKMYKSGKNWVTAMLLTATIGAFYIDQANSSSASADDQLTVSATSSSSSQVSSTANESSSSASQSSVSQSVASSTASSTTSEATDMSLNSSSNSSSATTNGSSSSINVISSSTASASSSSSSSSAAVAATSATQDTTTTSQPIRSISSSDDATIKKLIKKYGVENIQKKNGKYYYVDTFGDPHLGVTVQLGNQVLYFNGKTGALTSKKDLPVAKNETIKADEFTSNNAFYSVDSASVTTVGGYLVPDTWYRPKKILSNGSSWTATSASDMRPLLMSWWPNENVEANYLNFMNSNGLGATPSWHSVDDGSESLNQSARQVQAAIEKKIAADNGDTTWLHTLIDQFIKTQSEWNVGSEERGSDGLQGGQFLYVNNSLTSDADSKYRLLNRGLSNQDGKNLKGTIASGGDFEFLLGNDIDNSNPTVQAEDLNWLYYVMNLGTILKNNPNGNFDGVRVDAIDDVDSDLIQIIGKYFNDAYQTSKSDQNSNNHLSILEDWDNWIDPFYMRKNGNPQITMNPQLKNALQEVLSPADPTQRTNLDFLINDGLADRSADWNEVDDVIPSYSFFRAHDNSVQGIVGQIIQDKFDSTVNPDNPSSTMDIFQKALNIYANDEWKTNKKYTLYNTPAAYALLLTDKALVPRVYYGDMYMENKQFMEEKSPYYDSIDALLKARVKYVAGGQTSNVQTMVGAPSMAKAKDKYTGVLTSVRYGKNIWGPKNVNPYNKSGIAIVESNNPELKLSSTDKVVINMGASHKNQAFRPLLNTTKTGLDVFNSDSDVDKSQIKYTNSKGQLILTRADIKGYSNPQVSGYLSAWVPMGAADNQDSRTTASTKKTQSKNVKIKSNYVSNAALDSNVIFEGFSNFQSFPTTDDQRENVVIAKNANLFKQWGITSFEFPPQYNSTVGNSFLDETFQNGYAFSDRYNLGISGPNKYGTADELVQAIQALHENGIQAMADFVPDQVYDMPNQQLVTVKRVNNFGQELTGTKITNQLYYSNTVGSGTDYQSKYGGAFLEELQKMYPNLFTTTQISTGVPIDPSEKITTWSAKYMNGTNIQGVGTDYILNNGVTGQYLNVNNPSTLPLQMLGQSVTTGFVKNGNNVNYYTYSGYKATNTFIVDGNNTYYFDISGNMVFGLQKINGSKFFFLPDGTMLTNSVYRDSKGHQYYFGANGGMYNSGFLTNPETGNPRYFNSNGVMAKGRTLVNGKYQYFDLENGDQVAGDWGGKYYYDASTGNEAQNQFENIHNKWYYFNNNGKRVKGTKTINGVEYHFNRRGVQTRGAIVTNRKGIKKYYGIGDGSLIKNNTVIYKGVKYTANSKGVLTAAKS